MNYRDGITLTWQNGRELASYSDDLYDIDFTYDANGMRTTKDVSGWGEINYVYEGGLLLQMDYLGRIFNFSYDANGTPIGFRVTEDGKADEYYYYGVNSRGDIVSIYNVAGAEVIQYTYDAYGKPLTTSATSAYTSIATINPLRYRGYVYDKETGLYYLQSRYYDPVTCRFINADGYCSTGQGITGNNMFVYCGNNPILRIDLSGDLFGIIIAGALICAAVNFVSAVATEHAEMAIDEEDPFEWEDIIVSTCLGFAEGAISVACPPIAAYVGAASSGLDAAIDGCTDIWYREKDTTWGEVAIDTITSTGLGALTSLDGPCLSKNQRCLKTVIEHPTKQTIKNAAKFTGKVYLGEQVGNVVINATKEYTNFWLEKHFCR